MQRSKPLRPRMALPKMTTGPSGKVPTSTKNLWQNGRSSTTELCTRLFATAAKYALSPLQELQRLLGQRVQALGAAFGARDQHAAFEQREEHRRHALEIGRAHV